MKRLIIACLFTMLSSSLVAMDDPGLPDTVRVGTAQVYAGGKFLLPVDFFNDELLSAVELVFEFEPAVFSLDSISVVGGRLDYLPDSAFIRRDSGGLLNFWAYDPEGWIPTGNGLMCNLHFQVSPLAFPAHYEIDTARWFFSRTLFADSAATGAISPQFIKGIVNVIEAPPVADSVWVENAAATPGQSVAVDVYGYNEENLALVNLALAYSSDDLIYDTTIFSGTRGDLAQGEFVSVNSGLRQLLITLDYDEAEPLAPGTGPLATIVFQVSPTAGEQTVIVDSTRYLGSQPLQFQFTTELGGMAFTPYFSPGSVAISGTAGIDDDNDRGILPERYYLGQNAPNPFNPTTLISFDLPRRCEITLEVFNILGRQVAILAQGELPAGRHRIVFDGKDSGGEPLSSGIYFYRLKTDEYTQSRKMTLLK